MERGNRRGNERISLSWQGFFLANILVSSLLPYMQGKVWGLGEGEEGREVSGEGGRERQRKTERERVGARESASESEHYGSQVSQQWFFTHLNCGFIYLEMGTIK